MHCIFKSLPTWEINLLHKTCQFSIWGYLPWSIKNTYISDVHFPTPTGCLFSWLVSTTYQDAMALFWTVSHVMCCGQLWVWHIVCGQTCDGLYHFAIYLVNFGIPYGSHTIKPALARDTGVQVSLVPAKVIPNLCQSILAPIISNLRVYMGCALALVFQVRSLYVPWHLVHFQGSISGSP